MTVIERNGMCSVGVPEHAKRNGAISRFEEVENGGGDARCVASE